MNRIATIRMRLNDAIRAGKLSDYLCSSPGRKGRRWTVLGGGASRYFTTREVEAFLDGLELGAGVRRS